MELKTTEEFVREAHGAACSTWKQRIEKEFPDLFKTELVIGRWYKSNDHPVHIFFVTAIKNNRYYYYGFNVAGEYKNDEWYSFYDIGIQKGFELATHEEVESALIAEAKKRGYKAGVKVKECLRYYAKNAVINDKGFDFVDNTLWISADVIGVNICIFQDGKWAEILPEKKTIITKEKALKIIAKKLKVSPESIEIK